MTSPPRGLQQDGAQSKSSPRPAAIHIPKNRSGRSRNSSIEPAKRSGKTVDENSRTTSWATDGGQAEQEAYVTRSPILSPVPDTGLRRIRQQPSQQSRKASSPRLNVAVTGPSPQISPLPSRKSSIHQFPAPASPSLAFSDDLTRFPSESLHSFSFAHQSSESLQNRQNALKRSIEFMRDKLSWAASSPRIASAQARLAGDHELLTMMELLQKASIMSPDEMPLNSSGLGIDRGPLTGPAHMANENVFDKSFLLPTSSGPSGTIQEEPEELEESVQPEQPLRAQSVTESNDLSRIKTVDLPESSPPERPQRASLKRTYTDVAGYSLQQKLTEALAQPYHSYQSQSAMSTFNAPTFRPLPASRNGPNPKDRAPHGHRNNQAQAIFTTGAESPWTITAANDLACLVFGVTRAEVRKLGIMEVIAESRRQWLEERLQNPDAGSARRQGQQPPKANVAESDGAADGGKPAQSSALATAMGNGITAKLLSKPPPASRYSAAYRRSKTEGTSTPSPPAQESPKAETRPSAHITNKSRGVLLCGDVIPIRKMNGATGSASLWVKEKGGGLIWVLEEIAEDVAFLTVDEIGSILRGKGDVTAIWGIERVRNGMDITRLIPAFPKLEGTNTGALDYDVVRKLKSFTARTSNNINIPITVDQVEGDSSTFRVNSFPHIAGIMVLDPRTMKISNSNSVFSLALFGYEKPDGLPVVDLIPGFDKIMRVMTDEDDIELVDGIVIPEHSFRRARAVLGLREGNADAAAIFLKPSGLPARHRDGAEIMVDVQMRVVKSEREPLGLSSKAIVEEDAQSEVVYALWITYSRQLHAVAQGIGPLNPMLSRPGTPPQQPAPGSISHIDSTVPTPSSADTAIQEQELRNQLLSQQLEQAQAVADETSDAPSDQEPYEHPSSDMVAAGCRVVKKKRIDDFAILEEMGQGAYGQVKLSRYKSTAAKKMVIKYVTKRRILVDTWHRDRRLGTVPLEIHVLDYLRRDGLQHPNIVEMADFFEDDVNYYIEMVPHGLPGMDLFDYIELRVTMEESECRKIFCQVAEALAHLHGKAKVVHRDIKDENVILDGEGRVKLVDFGSAAYIKSGPFDVFVGTIDYAAPEVLRGLPYRGKEQDVWALGILLYTIVYKENPFYSIDEIMDHDLRVPYVMSEECIDLIRKMLDRDVEKRIAIQAVLEHPWCTAVDEEEDEVDDGLMMRT